MPASQPYPTLYSFRRCPYAMRARLTISYSQTHVELREVDLKDKPSAMLDVSSKATVPVLVLNDGTVIDESLDIMFWALKQFDPDSWLSDINHDDMIYLIKHNDNVFKIHLDHYKYSERFPEHPVLHYRQEGEVFLQQLETRLNNSRFLTGSTVSLADIALFPFIRQFAYTDIKWFDNSPYPALIKWLHYWLDCDLFQNSMQKYPAWQTNQAPIIF